MQPVQDVAISRFFQQEQEHLQDTVAVEAPLEIKIQFEEDESFHFSTILRTPGHDINLVTGLLFAEAIISHPEDIISVHHCHKIEPKNRENVVVAHLTGTADKARAKEMTRPLINSACGFCGSRISISNHKETSKTLESSARNYFISPDLLYSMSQSLMDCQSIFQKTGGLHAAALFEYSGKLEALAEDVGRHNALDKLCGRMFLIGALPISNFIVLMSGRLSYELVQKSDRAGVKVLAGIGAPSSLAIQYADQRDITLIGFLKDHRFNCYSHPRRIRSTTVYEN